MPRKNTLFVKAAHPDRPCPKIRRRRKIDSMTGRDKTCVYHDEVVEVPNVRYYRRRIIKGDLVEVKSKPRPPAPPHDTPRTESKAKKTTKKKKTESKGSDK